MIELKGAYPSYLIEDSGEAVWDFESDHRLFHEQGRMAPSHKVMGIQQKLQELLWTKSPEEASLKKQ